MGSVMHVLSQNCMRDQHPCLRDREGRHGCIEDEAEGLGDGIGACDKNRFRGQTYREPSGKTQDPRLESTLRNVWGSWMRRPRRSGTHWLVMSWIYWMSLMGGDAALLVYDRVISGGAPYYMDIALDEAGNLHLCGFAVIDGVPRALITKRSPDGASEIWSLQFGSAKEQIATGIDLDAEGNVYVSGWTSDPNFLVKNPLQSVYGGGESDAFLIKINSSGSTLLFSTYMGGSDKDFANQVKVGPGGNIFLTGTTFSENFPSAGNQKQGDSDAYVARLNSTGTSVDYVTLLGGKGTELGNGLMVDHDGNALLVGSTDSVDLPLLHPIQMELSGEVDAFIARFNASGAMDYLSYWGGSSRDYATGIVRDQQGNMILCGLTFSDDFPVRFAVQTELKNGDCSGNQACGDGFVTKLNSSGSEAVFSTYLGGNREENVTALTSAFGISLYGIDVDRDGFIYVTGTTSSLDFPTISGLQVSRRRGELDPFLAKFQPDGALVYAFPFGPGQINPGQNRLNVASSLVVDVNRNAYIAGASLAPSIGSGAGTPAMGYLAKVSDLPVLATKDTTIAETRKAPYLSIQKIRRLADETSQLDFLLPNGSGYRIDASTDLRSWVSLFTKQPPPPTNGGGGKQ